MSIASSSLSLSPERRYRAIAVGMTASIALYLLTAIIAEPMRGLAATSSSSQVKVEFAGQISLTCDGDNDGTGNEASEILDIGTLSTTDDDTDTPAFSTSDSIPCHVFTNNAVGYTVSWQITTGSGGFNTGYLISQYEDVIVPIGTATAETTPIGWSVAASDARWGVSVSTDSGSDPLGFGTFAANDVYARIGTGSSRTFAETSAPSQNGSGDLYKIGVRIAVGSSKVQPAGTYYVGDLADANAGILFTAATQ
jgi:hypothetical protein